MTEALGTRQAGRGSGGHGMKDEHRLLVDVDEAARLLSVSRRTLQSLVYSGAVQSVLVGRCRRIATADLVAYVDALHDGARSQELRVV